MVDFLIIGPRASIICGNIFPLVKDRRIMLGSLRKDISFGDEGISCRWFQNIREFKIDPLELKKQYNEVDYHMFDNYDCINIDRISDIPGDYDGMMGVPITFIDKWNPEQFEIIGLFCDRRSGNYLINGDSRYIDEGHKSYVGPVIDGKAFFSRIVIKKK